MHAVELGSLPLVSTAASLFRKLCYENKVRSHCDFCFLFKSCLFERTRCLLESFAVAGTPSKVVRFIPSPWEDLWWRSALHSADLDRFMCMDIAMPITVQEWPRMSVSSLCEQRFLSPCNKKKKKIENKLFFSCFRKGLAMDLLEVWSELLCLTRTESIAHLFPEIHCRNFFRRQSCLRCKMKQLRNIPNIWEMSNKMSNILKWATVLN